jgi:exoribonuclease-2
VVQVPKRWPRIGNWRRTEDASVRARPGALNGFLEKCKASDPDHYADISLAVVKLMGPGEYVLARKGEADPGHFARRSRLHAFHRAQSPLCRYRDAAVIGGPGKQSCPYPILNRM